MVGEYADWAGGTIQGVLQSHGRPGRPGWPSTTRWGRHSRFVLFADGGTGTLFCSGLARIAIEVEAPLRHVRVSYHPIIWNQNTPKIATLLIIWNQNTPKSRHFWPKRVRGRAAMWQRRGTANTTCVRLRDGRLARRFAASPR